MTVGELLHSLKDAKADSLVVVDFSTKKDEYEWHEITTVVVHTVGDEELVELSLSEEVSGEG